MDGTVYSSLQNTVDYWNNTCYVTAVSNTMFNFVYMLTIAMAQSLSDDSAIRYVLLVLWMTPHIA